jgi:two-component system sensor histidine kinase/response regulator
MVSRILSDKGFHISVASNGLDALNVVNSSVVDIILLDIMMPEMSGFEVCEQLKLNADTKDIPVIFLTAMNETDNIVKAFQIGGVDYITKPFNKEELLARLSNQVQLKLTRDLLKKYAEQYKDSRNSMMSVLLELGKIIN